MQLDVRGEGMQVMASDGRTIESTLWGGHYGKPAHPRDYRRACVLQPLEVRSSMRWKRWQVSLGQRHLVHWSWRTFRQKKEDRLLVGPREAFASSCSKFWGLGSLVYVFSQ